MVLAFDLALYIPLSKVLTYLCICLSVYLLTFQSSFLMTLHSFVFHFLLLFLLPFIYYPKPLFGLYQYHFHFHFNSCYIISDHYNFSTLFFQVDLNMQRAHEPNSVVQNKFFFRRFLAPVCVPDVTVAPVAACGSNVDIARAVASAAVIPSVRSLI